METLRTLREHSGKTQEQVAVDLEISVSYYSLLENGKRRLSLDRAERLARSLNRTLDEVYRAYRVGRRSTTGLDPASALGATGTG